MHLWLTQNPRFWSWLVTVNGNIDFQVAQAFVNLTKALAVFLSIIIVSEIAIVVYVHSGIDQFAKQILNSLSTETAQSATKKFFLLTYFFAAFLTIHSKRFVA